MKDPNDMGNTPELFQASDETALAISTSLYSRMDFDSDEPLACPMRDQSGDTTCESCQ